MTMIVMGKNRVNKRINYLPPDDPVYSLGLVVAGIPVEKRVKEENINLEPESYSGFLTKVLRSILKVAPDMSKHVYTYGMTLHPDVKGKLRLGQSSDLPERITVRCYKSWDKVAARFQVFPKEPRARGLIRAVRLDDSIGKPAGRSRPAVKKVSRKAGTKP